MYWRRVFRRATGAANVEARFNDVSAALNVQLDDLGQRIREIQGQQQGLSELHGQLNDLKSVLESYMQTVNDRSEAAEWRLAALLQLAIEDEPRARQQLDEARRSDDYATRFDAAEPLVSVVIPTYQNIEGLRSKSVPSVLNQTYANIEVVIVGDGAPEETERVVCNFGDDRVAYENLTRRGPYPDDPVAFWQTAGIPALNRGTAIARGQWFAILNDDDAYRPDFVARLLAHARAERLEVAYGKLRHHEPGEPQAQQAFHS